MIFQKWASATRDAQLSSQRKVHHWRSQSRAKKKQEFRMLSPVTLFWRVTMVYGQWSLWMLRLFSIVRNVISVSRVFSNLLCHCLSLSILYIKSIILNFLAALKPDQIQFLQGFHWLLLYAYQLQDYQCRYRWKSFQCKLKLVGNSFSKKNLVGKITCYKKSQNFPDWKLLQRRGERILPKDKLYTIGRYENINADRCLSFFMCIYLQII